MIAAVCLFLMGAAFGVYMFVRHLARRPVPPWAAMGHGAFVVTGFALVLLLLVRTSGAGFVREALVILIAAIALGVVNLLFHVRRVRHRTVLILLHAVTGVAGVGTLAYGGLVAGPASSVPAAPPALPPARGSSEPVARTEPVAPMASAATLAATFAAAPPPVASAPIARPPTLPAAREPAFHAGPAWSDRPLVFDRASATLDERNRAALAEVANDLQRHPEVKLVEVQGHTDENGDDAGNVRLSRARAVAVVDFLVAAGVARERLRSAGYGARCPADPRCGDPVAPPECHARSSWERDRRVTLLALEAGGETFRGQVACERGLGLVPPDDRRYANR